MEEATDEQSLTQLGKKIDSSWSMLRYSEKVEFRDLEDTSAVGRACAKLCSF